MPTLECCLKLPAMDFNLSKHSRSEPETSRDKFETQSNIQDRTFCKNI